jgi:hypothetical protein
MDLRGLLFGKPKVAVRVSGDAIVVTLPGTTFQVTYKRHNGSLVATDFRGTDVQRKITIAEANRIFGYDARVTRVGYFAWGCFSNSRSGPAFVACLSPGVPSGNYPGAGGGVHPGG